MTELAMSDVNPPARVSLLTLVSFRGVGIIWETPGQFRLSSRQSGSDPTKNQAIPSDASRQAPTHLAIAPQKGMLLRTALSFDLAPVLTRLFLSTVSHSFSAVHSPGLGFGRIPTPGSFARSAFSVPPDKFPQPNRTLFGSLQESPRLPWEWFLQHHLA